MNSNKKLTGAVAKRAALAKSVNNFAIKTGGHPPWVEVNKMTIGYATCPVTKIENETVRLDYFVLQVIPLGGDVPFVIDFDHLVDEWGRVTWDDAKIAANMEEHTLKCFHRNEMKHICHVGPLFATEDEAKRWSQLCARQMVFNAKIAKRRLVTHIMRIDALKRKEV